MIDLTSRRPLAATSRTSSAPEGQRSAPGGDRRGLVAPRRGASGSTGARSCRLGGGSVQRDAWPPRADRRPARANRTGRLSRHAAAPDPRSRSPRIDRPHLPHDQALLGHPSQFGAGGASPAGRSGRVGRWSRPRCARAGRTRFASPPGTAATRRGGCTTACSLRRSQPPTGSSRCRPGRRPTARSRCARTSEAGVEHVRFVLGIEDDHSEFLRRFADDPMIGEATRRFRGLRPLRTGDRGAGAAPGGRRPADPVEPRARDRARRDPRRDAEARRAPRAADRGRLRALLAAQLERLGLGARRGSTLVRLSRSIDLEALKGHPTDAVARTAAARARARAVVDRRRLPPGARPLRARARARSRPRQARLRAVGTARRGRGDGRAAGAVRGVGRARERVPAGGLWRRTRRLAR